MDSSWKRWLKNLARAFGLIQRVKRNPYSRTRPALEFLECRISPAAIVVNSTGDANNPGTLRWAIGRANATPGQPQIVFEIPGTVAPVIHIRTALPVITGGAYIIGGLQQNSWAEFQEREPQRKEDRAVVATRAASKGGGL